MGYVFRGTPDTKPIRSRLVFDPSKCGTRMGYKQHQNHGIPQCDPCKAANNEYMKAYYRRRKAAA